jgi:L-alanine-DL-glutamate epimerase-like enolase superfamily enzyme
MVDAGQAFQVQPALLERGRLLRQFDIDWLEEPLSQDDLRGYAELCVASRVPIAAGEGEVTGWGVRRLD